MKRKLENQTWRCEHCTGFSKNRHFGLRKRVAGYRKNVTVEQAVEEVVIRLKEIITEKKWWFTKEELMNETRIRPVIMQKALMKLNQAGLVSRRVNRAPHDSNREPHGFSNSPGMWQASHYYASDKLKEIKI